MIFTAVANIPGKPGDAHWEQWKAGDVVFLNGNSVRSKVVRLLQGYSTDYSHVGMVVMEKGIPFIVHADPAEDKVVRQRWDVVVRQRQVSGGAIFRLDRADVSIVDAACAAVESYAAKGTPFDHEFDLRTPGRLFCTELVLRAYRSAGVDLGKDAERNYPHFLPAELLRSSSLRRILQF